MKIEDRSLERQTVERVSGQATADPQRAKARLCRWEKKSDASPCSVFHRGSSSALGKKKKSRTKDPRGWCTKYFNETGAKIVLSGLQKICPSRPRERNWKKGSL